MEVLKRTFSYTRSMCRCLSTKKDLKKTTLYDFHVSKGGKMIDFANYLMPLVYNEMTLVDSHLHTRSKCSLFDVSHMVQTLIHGKDKIEWLESLVVSDIFNLENGKSTLSLLTNSRGGIIDDLIITKDNDTLYLVTNASCREKDLSLMQESASKWRENGKDVRVEILEDSLIALQGPASVNTLEQLGANVNNLKFMNSKQLYLAGTKCRITRCGYTGEDGFEISIPKDKTIEIVEILLKNSDVRLAGLGARDSLRIEAGLCLYGNDITEDTTPVEGSLSWIIPKTRRDKGNFPGADVILNQLKNGAKRKRIGIKGIGRGPPARPGTVIIDPEIDETIGIVTSGCPSPSLGSNIAMGYVKWDGSKIGKKVHCDIRMKRYDYEISQMPFISTNYRRN